MNTANQSLDRLKIEENNKDVNDLSIMDLPKKNNEED